MADAWQFEHVTAEGPFPGNTALSGQALVWAGAGALVLAPSTPTTAQYHPSHHSFEFLTITLQAAGGSVGGSLSSSFTIIAPSGGGPTRCFIHLNSEGEYQIQTKAM